MQIVGINEGMVVDSSKPLDEKEVQKYLKRNEDKHLFRALPKYKISLGIEEKQDFFLKPAFEG